MSLSKKLIIFTILIVIVISMGNVVFARTGIVNTETLNLRESPTTEAAVLKLLNMDEKVEILEEDGQWYKINANGTIGYVHGDYIKIEEDNDENINNTTVSNTNTVTNPDEGANNVEISNSEIVNEITSTGDVSEPESGKTENHTQIPSQINISKEIDIYILPLINSTKISKTIVGETVSVISSTNKWLYISASEVNGWVIADQAIENTSENTNNNEQTNNNEETSNNENNNSTTNNEEKPQENAIEEKTMYVNASSIYIRQGPGTDYEIVDSLILNSEVTVTAEEGDWYKVKVSGKEGYIAKWLLSDSKKETTSRGDVDRESSSQPTTEVSNESTASVGEELVAYAKQFLGCKYVYGGSGPSTFDCSGFTMYVYNKYGVALSHSATAQSKKGTYVAKEDLQPGDLVFFKDYETMVGIGHCGIYIGNGEFIHASSGTGYCVKISTLLSGSYNTRYETARRVL